MCIYSHPDTFIQDHVNGVLELARGFNKDELPSHLLIAVALHDFGKATEEFQKYILGQEKKKTTHAFLSALYTLYVCKEKLKLPDEECFWAFFYVERHHGDITKDIIDYCNGMLEKSLTNELSKELLRVNSIDKQELSLFLNSLDIGDELKSQLAIDDGFKKWTRSNYELFFEGIKKIFYRRIIQRIKKGQFHTDFWKRLSEFSLLLDADKSQAGTKAETFQEIPIFINHQKIEECKQKIEEYKKGLKSTPLNEKREEAYREVLSCNKNARIYNLTLPTGMGKTLTGLAFALKNSPRRIIYALPFLSVVEQVQKTLEDMGLEAGQDFIVHHHLTEYPQSEEEYQISRVLVEGWNAGIVLTTFHQLFYTMFPHKNTYIRRLNKLRDSFIIIDEVQALPSKYWRLAKDGIKLLVEELNCKVLYMTATQPYLTEGGIDLVDARRYRKGLDRYRIVPATNITTMEELIEHFSKEMENSSRRYLFVLNTKSSARELYKGLKEKGFKSITYLSTDLVPIHRKQRIDEIKEGKYRIVVSTQLVEAGVDIDFDVVVRDIAPLDSIVQSAGRCNRNNQKGQSLVYVVNLKERNHKGKEKDIAEKIYDSLLLDRTKKYLNELTESQLLNILEDYFNDVWNTAIEHEESEELLESIARLNFSKLKEFELIKEEPYKESIYVCVNEEAELILHRAREVIRRLKNGEINTFEAKRQFEMLKSSFYSYVVNATPEGVERDDLLGIYVAPKELYDEEVGYTGKLENKIW